MPIIQERTKHPATASKCGLGENVARSRDILETGIYKSDPEILHLLLCDRSTGRNLRWATKDYIKRGVKGFSEWDHITIKNITGKNGSVIQPRVDKSSAEQRARVEQRAEVFTPSWVCNKQNNLVDAAWFERDNAGFNEEVDGSTHGWKTLAQRIAFPKQLKKTWWDYIKAPRLEVSCGEAPYLTSRYDTVTGDFIPTADRIGFLDRKLRIVSENAKDKAKWLEGALWSLKSVYGYEYQGDNVLLARENVLFAVKEYYEDIFKEPVPSDFLRSCAVVISWNIWQMDGIKFVVPGTCHNARLVQMNFLDPPSEERGCPGCRDNDPLKHNGIRCRIKAWESETEVYFKPPFDFEPIAKEAPHE